jgi:hypothetical protein
MSTLRTCPTCGYTHTYATTTLADTHHPRHSCAYQTRHARTAQRRAQSAMQRATGELTRDCIHPGTPHIHGERVAYVKDRCRCTPCTTANTAESRHAKRQQTYGRWDPYVDAAPVRAHIQTLRDGGVSYDQIAHVANTSTSHIRELAGTVRRSGNRPAIRRVRPNTADRIMSIHATTVDHPHGSLVDATGTRRRLQALAAVGWSQPNLATELGRNLSSLNRSMTAGRVLAGTAEQVRTLYDQLWLIAPPDTTPAQRAQRDKARTWAREQGWPSPLAWDDIDATIPNQPINANDIDEIAVQRAVAGDGIQLRDLTNAEQTEAVRRLTERGKSIRDIAELLATTTRTVSRRRVSATSAA